ncbi:MAG: serine hydrolase, partial [Acidobacteriota bacterium]
MRQLLRLFSCIALLSILAFAQKSGKHIEINVPAGYQAPMFQDSPELQAILNGAVNEVLKSYPADGFKPDDIAATLIDLRDQKQLRWANVRGDESIYPASVVKMFYMAALHRQLQDGKLKSTPELMRGQKDMIVDSSNEATQYILDVLTDTSSGSELPAEA